MVLLEHHRVESDPRDACHHPSLHLAAAGSEARHDLDPAPGWDATLGDDPQHAVLARTGAALKKRPPVSDVGFGLRGKGSCI